MDAQQKLDLPTIRRLAQHALSTMTDAEAETALAWLRDNVLSADSVAAQIVLFEAWLSVHDRLNYQLVFEN